MKKSNEFTIPGRILRCVQALGLCNARNLLWSFYEPRNFGDWIGPYLYEAIKGKAPIHYSAKIGGRSTGYAAAGSIMRHLVAPDRISVWGSGIISQEDVFQRPRSVHAVRGPKTRDHVAKLGFDTSEVFGDPAILMPLFYKPAAAKAYRIGLIPHFTDVEVLNTALADRPDVRVIDVCRDVETVIDDIAACEVTLSSSLHGVILSHSYDIPCAWINSVKPLHGDGIKFQDYFESGGVFGAAPTNVDLHTDLNALVNLANTAPQPDVISLQQPLLDVCPF